MLSKRELLDLWWFMVYDFKHSFGDISLKELMFMFLCTIPAVIVTIVMIWLACAAFMPM